MKITETIFEGCFVLKPKIHEDNRGLFFESYQKKRFEEGIGKQINFAQDNISISKKGVLRGLHYQTGEHAQAKLVQVLKGEVIDVVVDLRKGSKTFGKYLKLKLSSENRKAIFIPKGMAHGFLTLTEEVVFIYKCDNYYDQASESGIIYNDVDLGIDWGYPLDQILLSVKDKHLPAFKDLYS